VRSRHRAKSASSKISAQIFTSRAGASGNERRPADAAGGRQTQIQVEEVAEVFANSAPNPRHMAVDGLHSIDFQADKRPLFLLTGKIEGVKTDSFFDCF
jgi:hypothetical protein